MTEPNIDAQLQSLVDELLSSGITLPQLMDAIEERYVKTALAKSNGNVTQASKKLGVHRNTLHNKLRPLTQHRAAMATRGPKSRWSR
jgi:DNA-binding NtrC family response regulator